MTPETEAGPLSNSFTGRQWKILVVLATCNFLSAIVKSLQAPFYPAEFSLTIVLIGAYCFSGCRRWILPEYGFVFGVYSMVGFAASPLISKLFRKFLSMTTFLIGYLTVASSTILFGFLDKINDHTTFIVLSFALRILEALGGSTVFITSYTFVAVWFPGSIATVFAVMETMFLVGYAAGPPYGGLLFQAGGESFGFTLPFLFTGCLVILTSLLAVSILPKINSEEAATSAKKDTSKRGFFTLLRFPTILIYAISVMSSTLASGFIDSTLEPHLRQFSLSPLQVGLVFLVYGAVNAITTFVWGLICDRITRPEYATLTGTIIMFGSFTTIGPLFFLPFESSVAITGPSLAIFGLGNAAVNVSTFALLLSEAKKNGFPDTASTGAACTGLWLSAVSFGGTIGPSLGGILLDAYGFRVATVFVAGLLAFVSLLLLGPIFVRPQGNSVLVDSEKVPLLASEN